MSAFDESQLPMTLKPLARATTTSRLGALYVGVLGLGVLAAGVFGVLPTVAAAGLIIVGAAGVLLSLLLIARTGSVSVTLTTDFLVLRGQFSTRTVPRNAIKKVTDEPLVIWRDGAQRDHRTWLTGLALYRDQGRTGGMNTSLRSDLQTKLSLVRAWAGEPASATEGDSFRW
ncbi:hypothetical protein [Gryllotalpicola protaetiae]|uniref:PH domain-containing protein n=1 Tax=Gryllotalpicola protaetiae TaxID=2419771 RepID=A0A387BHR2_9MICO|nr:hypothetical protein [Gryllotalpicola protaetiae]AYG02198.1 hypothetical protein D7I44_00725 [Gryllotalpicola protaetiae]